MQLFHSVLHINRNKKNILHFESEMEITKFLNGNNFSFGNIEQQMTKTGTCKKNQIKTTTFSSIETESTASRMSTEK